MTCVQNPAVGYEKDWGAGTLTRAPRSKKVLVAGGGPAGLEAAVTAAQRGHEVVLCEATGCLGGQIELIRKSPRRDEFRVITEWRQRQLEKLSVDLRLGTEVTVQLVRAVGPEAVIVATGSIPRTTGWYPAAPALDSIPGSDQPHVFSPRDVLRGALDEKRHVVVVDGTGYYQASDAAEYLAARGIQVSAVTAEANFNAGASMVDRPAMLASLRKECVTIYVFTVVTHIASDAVHAVENLNGKSLTIGEVDAVVLSLDYRMFGGSFMYPLSDTLVALGLVVGLDHPSASFDPHRLLQKMKTHPCLPEGAARREADRMGAQRRYRREATMRSRRGWPATAWWSWETVRAS